MFPVRVVAIAAVADDTRSLTLRRPDRSDLPAWQPGAHLDVRLPSGVARQYSLCSDPSDLGTYRIAVLNVADGRGGSRELHTSVGIGSVLEISEPKNHFPLAEADSYLLCAGGIGITPILSMARELNARDRSVTLVYAGRSRYRLAFLDELAGLDHVHVVVVPEDEDGRPDWRLMLDRTRPDAVYACGPAGMLDAVTAACEATPPPSGLHIERFVAASDRSTAPATNDSFEVELATSGMVVTVSSDESVLAAVRRAGVEVPSSCEQGICGTCETKVLQGRVDHRDQLLTDAERASGATMMICVSRSCEPKLVLDL